MTPVEYDCMELRKAIQGIGTDDSTLIELLTSRSNKRLKEISALYLQCNKNNENIFHIIIIIKHFCFV